MLVESDHILRNLVLVHSQGWQDVSDFQAIKRLVEEMAPDIEVFIASNDSRSSLTRKKAARRPALVFSPIRLMHFQPDRGRIYAGQAMSKLEEMRILTEADMPVPRFAEIKPETRLSPRDYGPRVIVKPSYELASWGQGIELIKTEHVRFRLPSDYPEWHPGRRGPMIAQQFIDSGKPMTCRVLTLFGAPLFTFCRESTRKMSLDPDKILHEQADYMPAPPHVIGYSTRDPEFLSLAAKAFQAMPQIALQACDIMRDRDGGLHLLEINPGGGTWMLSSPSAPGYRKALGVENLAAEFDAFRTCARVLIERTRAEAV